VGLPFNVIPTHIFDMQVRFTLKFFTGQREFPSREQMIAELEQEIGERWGCGVHNHKKAHQMGERQVNIKLFNTSFLISGTCMKIYSRRNNRIKSFKKMYVKYPEELFKKILKRSTKLAW